MPSRKEGSRPSRRAASPKPAQHDLNISVAPNPTDAQAIDWWEWLRARSYIGYLTGALLCIFFIYSGISPAAGYANLGLLGFMKTTHLLRANVGDRLILYSLELFNVICWTMILCEIGRPYRVAAGNDGGSCLAKNVWILVMEWLIVV
jgi:hypothetical protein